MFKKNRSRFKNLGFHIRSRSFGYVEDGVGHNDEDNVDSYYSGSNSLLVANNNATSRRSDGELAAFDACVEACDALAASSPSIQNCKEYGKVIASERTSGTSTYTEEEAEGEGEGFQLPDCFVRVSPDGELMFLPVPIGGGNSANTSSHSLLDTCENNSNESGGDGESQKDNENDNTDHEIESEAQTDAKDESFTLAHMPPIDFQSTVVVGSDRSGGDLEANGFSANGWSVEIAGSTFRQSSVALQLTSDFVEKLLLTRKDSAANMSNACYSIRNAILDGNTGNANATKTLPTTAAGQRMLRKIISKQTGSHANHNPSNFLKAFQAMESPGLGVKSSFPTLNAAFIAMEHYHSVTSEADSERWRKASQSNLETHHSSTNTADSNKNNNMKKNSNHHGISCLPEIQDAAQKTAKRAMQRELALQRAMKLAEDAEEKLINLKAEAQMRWAAVREAEESSRMRINEAIQQRMEHRAHERERRRMEKEREAMMNENANIFSRVDVIGDAGDVSSASTLPLRGGGGGGMSAPTPTQEEIWELVSEVTDSFDQGSFAPTFTLPTQNLHNDNNNDSMDPGDHEPEPPFVNLTPMEQMQIEYDCNVPRLRSAAKASNEAVEDAVGALLNALSNLDTTHRSARIAVEAGLLSAANSQADCFRSLVQLEKASLQERLRELENFETKVNEINVRSDLAHCIDEERKDPNFHGMTREDDDGGIASALAVLNCHRESVGGMTALENQIGNVVLEGWGSTDETGIVSREEIEDMIQYLFNNDPNKETKPNDANGNNDHDGMPQTLEEIVSFVTDAVKDRNKMSRIHRAMVCAALNKQRSIQTEMIYDENFDGLCNILKALLSGCDRQTDDIDNAKMCMILAQTFYKIGNHDDNADGDDFDDDNSELNSSLVSSSSERVQARSKRIYVKDKIKDHPIWSDEHFWDQALFQCISDALTKSGVLRSFQTQDNNKTIEWHDLNPAQRSEAASQLHAVIAAQLGALAHSMVEFGCGIEGACAFVRRMSIRHQLPISKRAILLQHLAGGRVSKKGVSSNAGSSTDVNTATN